MPSYLHETREQSIMWVLSKVKNIPDNVAMLKVHHRNIASWLPLEVNPIIAFQMTNKKKKKDVRQAWRLHIRTCPDLLK